MKYVHNRPFESGVDRVLQSRLRNRQLYIFLIWGAPLVLFSMKKSGVLLKDMVTIHTTLSPNANNESGLFMRIRGGGGRGKRELRHKKKGNRKKIKRNKNNFKL